MYARTVPCSSCYRRFFRLIDKGLRPLVKRDWGPSLWLIPLSHSSTFRPRVACTRYPACTKSSSWPTKPELRYLFESMLAYRAVCGRLRPYVRACVKWHHHFPPYSSLVLVAVPVHLGDRKSPPLAHPPFFPLKLSPRIPFTGDVMLPSLAISIFPPHFLAGDFICSKLPRVGPTLLLVEEHVTYLPPVMSTISHGPLARPEETSMVVAVAFSDKRSLFTAVMMQSLVAYAIGAQDS